VLDAILTVDPRGRVGLRKRWSRPGVVIVAGPKVTNERVGGRLKALVRKNRARHRLRHFRTWGFDGASCGRAQHPSANNHPISPKGVDRKERGVNREAGDQGLMVRLCPPTKTDVADAGRPITLAHRLVNERQAPGFAKKTGKLSWLASGREEPGGTLRYENGQSPWASRRSFCPPSHSDDISTKQLREAVMGRKIFKSRCCRPSGSTKRTKYHINPTGRFVIGGTGGPICGLTGGRKDHRRHVMVALPAMAGARFSGKDPSQRWIARPLTAARYVAKNIVRRPAWPSGARCSSPTPSAWPTRLPSWSRPSARGKLPDQRP